MKWHDSVKSGEGQCFFGGWGHKLVFCVTTIFQWAQENRDDKDSQGPSKVGRDERAINKILG